MGQLGFFIDATRCIKCFACEIACQQWHELKAGTYLRRQVHEFCEGSFPYVARTFLSLSCMHCAQPACVGVCPVGAITKREEDGLVVGNSHLCIGCRSCALACPFDVPRYTDAKLMDKCDGCISLGVFADDGPRCVQTCPTQALHFGPIEAMAECATGKDGHAMPGDTKPSVYYATRNENLIVIPERL